MGTFCVNRSGGNVGVYKAPSQESELIGTLVPNAVFTWLSEWAGNGWGFKAHLIYFKGSDGKFYEGYVTNAPSNAGWMTPLINCKLHDGDMQDGNGTVGVFQLRRAVKLYDSNAKFVTVIPKDYFVSTKSGVSGQEYKSRMHITSYGYSGPSASGGFIELGDGGMTFDTFPLIGVLR